MMRKQGTAMLKERETADKSLYLFISIYCVCQISPETITYCYFQKELEAENFLVSQM